MLTLTSVSKSFGDMVALNGLSLSLPHDRYVSLLGASGSGKTTLLRIIAGFDEPDSGTLSLDGRRLDGTPPHERGIGFVFQNFALFPHLTVEQNIAFGLRYRAKGRLESRDEIAGRVADMVRLVGLEGLEKRKVMAVSGGQRQRVALARTLVTEPGFVLLDEPLGALDANLRERMCDELRAIRERLKVTFFHVTGSESEALMMGETVAVLSRGVIAQSGPASALFETPADAEVARHLAAYNILKGRAEGGRFVFPAASFPLPGGVAVPSGAPIEVALRFDRIRVLPAASGAEGIPARFVASEFTGASTLSFFRTGDGALLQVVAPVGTALPEPYAEGEPYLLAFDSDLAIPFLERAA
ncbi:ABC transporter ATP-binding protein [Aureimonas populi]|uniref:ABC transporter ATP-binding protein n=1 Tax=Aureimonas populi TaxID=1701758 RepID=A0ABW5CUB3_9HYPH|nr:ABC transporter ATP-binding protein [Aureimonas populi]